MLALPTYLPATPEESVLISLIRGEPFATVLDRCNQDELARLAALHRVEYLLAASVMVEEGINPEWRRWAAFSVLSSQHLLSLCAKAARNTVTLLQAGGITPIQLKGPSLALGKPRAPGDVDLLIPTGTLMRSIALLESAGYEYCGYGRNMYIKRREYRAWEGLARWSNQFEFTEPETGILIELHTAFFETERVYTEKLLIFRSALDEFFAASVLDADTGIRYLALEDRALLLALHSGLKRAPVNKEFRLRHLADLDNLAKAGLDWERLEKRAFHFGAAHHLVFLLRLYEGFAGSCAPPGYVEQLEGQLKLSVVCLIRLHLQCLTGLEKYHRGLIFVYKWSSPFILPGTLRGRIRSLLIFPLVLPPPFKLATIYGLPERSRLVYLLYILEPVQWVYRLLRKTGRMLVAILQKKGLFRL